MQKSLPRSIKATVYTQVIKFSQVIIETPPNPQFWGNKSYQSPPGTPRIGGHGGGGFRGHSEAETHTGKICLYTVALSL